MAKVFGVGSQLSGKVGQITYRQTKYGTVAYESPVRAKVPRRSEKQMYIRMQWANLAAVYRQFNDTLKQGFEGLGNAMSVYNAFIQANTNVVRVYITKQVRLNGGSVLAPYQITRGTLPSIVTTVNGSGVLVSDLSLGGLTISGTTTVAEFAQAVIAYNDDWEPGDQLTFFYGQQTVDAVTGIPRAKINGFKVVLDVTDSTPLWNIVTALGFTTVDGKLGMSQTITDGAAAWIHSRENEANLKVSTQFFYVDSSVLASYQGESAFGVSANSYGGINTKAVYLNPEGGSGLTVNGSGLNGNENENQNGNGSSSGSNGSSGSSTTVAAPTIGGNSTFAETTQVTMSGPAGATIYYTTDGTTPTSASTQYTEALTLSDTTTVKAVAIKDGVSSSVTTRVFTKGTNTGGNGGDGEE